MTAAIPENEENRLKSLHSIEILETAPDSAFDALVRLVSMYFDAPIVLFTLVDKDRQWFKAKIGIEVCETCRTGSFCSYAILGNDVMVVEDATKDARFSKHPMVVGEPKVRFYAGAPLIFADEHNVGTLCIIDNKPRKFSNDDIAALQDFARQASALIAMHDYARRAKLKAKKLASINKELSLDQVIIANMSEGMAYYDKDAKLVSVNPSACEIFGISNEEYISRDLKSEKWKVVNENGKPFLADDYPATLCLATGVAINNVIMGVERPGGETAWIKVSAQPVRDVETDDVIGTVTTFSDVSDAKNLEEELRIKTREAEVANKTKSKFLANMSHEIRTPLNGVIGMASVLEKTNLDAKQREMIGLMLSSGRSLEHLLSDILDLSKVDAGQIELEALPFNLEKAIGDVVNVLKYRANEKGLDVEVKFDFDQKREIIGDVLRFKQIISNLASNAVKFTDQGKVSLDVHLNDNDTLEIKVSDTGIGMDAETLANVFNRFIQADASISRRFGGSGLGLSIAKGLVDLMGGQLSAKSEPNQGTCFTILLPVQTAQIIAEIAPIEASKDLSATMPEGIKLLLVEDHLVNQKVFQMMMEPLGIDVIIANNGLEGVEAFKSQKFDIVFMDIQMPIMDGLEATKLIRDIERRSGGDKTPIIALSANAGKNHIEVAMNSGADDYLTKPIDFMRLCEKLSEYLSTSEAAPLRANAS